MFNVPVPEAVRDYARQEVSLHNFGQRSYANGSPEEQVTGLVGECVVRELFELPRPQGADGYDAGVDLEYEGLRLDVKTMGRVTYPRRDYVNNFVGLQAQMETDVLLFCSLHKLEHVLTVCGWLPKEVFLKRAERWPQGSQVRRSDGTFFTAKADIYTVNNRQLNSPKSAEQLRGQLTLWSRTRRR